MWGSYKNVDQSEKIVDNSVDIFVDNPQSTHRQRTNQTRACLWITLDKLWILIRTQSIIIVYQNGLFFNENSKNGRVF